MPPVVYAVRALYERRFCGSAGRGLFRGVYGDFQAAIAAAPSKMRTGYDHSLAAEMYADRPVFAEDYAVLFWLRPLLASGAKVLDFGGHAGGMFDAFGELLSWPEDLSWTIYDVPAVVERGEALYAERSGVRPRFIDDLARFDGADLILASGSPQYCDAEFAQTVLSLGERPSHVIFNQVPLCEGQQFVTLQNIGTAFCPYWVRNREAFLQPLLDQGYELVDMWSNPGKECRIPTYPRQTRPEYFGGYLRRMAGGSAV